MPMLLLSCLPSLFCLSFCFLHLGALLLGQGLLSKSPQSKGSSSEIITRETLKATSSDGSHASGVGRLISTEALGLCIQCTRSPQAAAKAREHTRRWRSSWTRPQNRHARARRGPGDHQSPTLGCRGPAGTYIMFPIKGSCDVPPWKVEFEITLILTNVHSFLI